MSQITGKYNHEIKQAVVVVVVVVVVAGIFISPNHSIHSTVSTSTSTGCQKSPTGPITLAALQKKVNKLKK